MHCAFRRTSALPKTSISNSALEFSTFVPTIILIFASVLWGLSWIPIKFFNDRGLDGIPLVFASQLIIAVLLTPKGLDFERIRQSWKPALGIALCGGSAILCFTYSLMHGDVVRVMVLFYLLPVWGVIGGKVFLNEQIDIMRWIGVIAAVIGAFLIVGGMQILNSPPTLIDLWALLSGVFFAANNLFFRGSQSLTILNKLLVMFYGSVFIAGGLLLIDSPVWSQNFTPNTFIWLLCYSLFWLLLANLGTQWAVTQMEAGRSSIIIIMELVVAVVSAVLLNESFLTPIETSGCILVIIAAFIEATRTNEPSKLPKS